MREFIVKKYSKKELVEESKLVHRQIYDFIRMLDGEGYPKAYFKLGVNKFELFDAEFKESKLEMKMKQK